MAIKVRDAGTLRTITGCKVKVGGVLRTLRDIKVMDGGVLRTVATFASPMSVAVNGVSASDTFSTLTTNACFATVAGGLGPFTYTWALITNGGRTASTANSPTSAATTFTKTGLLEGDDITDTWRVTATDSFGTTATDDALANFFYPTED